MIDKEIDWNQNDFFSKHYADEITEPFKEFWIKQYGGPWLYDERDEEQQEYWMRCAFCWMGWKGRDSKLNESK